jgi:hypothetical protein
LAKNQNQFTCNKFLKCLNVTAVGQTLAGCRFLDFSRPSSNKPRAAAAEGSAKAAAYAAVAGDARETRILVENEPLHTPEWTSGYFHPVGTQ